MNLAGFTSFRQVPLRVALVAAVLTGWTAPAMAQNKKGAWEVFLYFGSFYKNDIPSASQYGDLKLYRVEPAAVEHLCFLSGPCDDPNSLAAVFTPNLGKVGGEQPPDPNYTFTNGNDNIAIFFNPPCNFNNRHLQPGDSRAPYFDECDSDQEERYIYNGGHITTNGAIQRDDSEFTLGLRGGYNITRHWEVELDIGFGKQRIDLTKNLNPLLQAQINDISDPKAKDLAEFYQFTWANRDWQDLYFMPANQLTPEHPSVVASRHAADPNYNIPVYFPIDPFNPSFRPKGETFADVTGFINRVFLNPTAFRSRGNQINVDQFTVTASVNYNFNTKADSRIIPYLAAGYGRWTRNFDSPWEGDNSNALTYGGGIRFFVNEIFSFRADARLVHYLDKSFTIRGQLHNFNLPDRDFFGAPDCMRDNRDVRPPCAGTLVVPASFAFPQLHGGGGNADIAVEAELDDFYEIRMGFDVVLGGK